MLALFIILVGLIVTLFTERMLISIRCIRGFMSNLIKQSWKDSKMNTPRTRQIVWLFIKCQKHWTLSMKDMQYEQFINLLLGSCCYFWILLGFAWALFKGTKGQLISKGLFIVFICTKNEQKYFCVSALASKKRSNQKNKGNYTSNWRILFWLSYTTFFDLTSF